MMPLADLIKYWEGQLAFNPAEPLNPLGEIVLDTIVYLRAYGLAREALKALAQPLEVPGSVDIKEP